MATGDAQRLLEAGIAATRAGNRAQARELLAQAVRQDPSNEQGWLWLAGVVDRPEETIYCLEQALVLNPNNEAARRGIAWARQRLTASAPAVPPATPTPEAAPAPLTPEAIPAAPPAAAPPEAMVSALRMALSPTPGRDEPARPIPTSETPDTLAARVVAGKASLPQWEARGLTSLRSLETVDEMVARGGLTMEQGRVEEAADILRGAIARQPDHAEAHAQLAVAYYHMEDKQGALVEFENAIASDPNYIEAHFSLGQIYEELGETKAAIHCWKRVLELDPRHTEARENLEKARASQVSRYQCPNCGTALSGLEPSCPQCGRVFFVRCVNCGEYVEEREETCPRCGASLEGAELSLGPRERESEAPEEVRGPQVACLRCGSLNAAYHTRCTVCGTPISADEASRLAAPFPRSRRRLRITWLLITLLSWIAACGLCLWGIYAGYQIVPLTALGSADPMGVVGDLLAQPNDSLLAVAALGTSLLLGFVGRIGWRLARS